MSNSLRVSIHHSLDKRRFGALIELLSRYPGFTDEITFFTSETHPPIPLEEFKRRADILSERMDTARRAGYRTGINVLSTIGHHGENLENSLSLDYPHFTDINGAVCEGSICPNHKKSQDYIRQIYIYTVQARPDYIWIDDDVRLAGHKPVVYGCFCDKCMEIFAEEYGKLYTREEFAAAVNSSDLDSAIKLRKNWLQHNRNTIERLFKLIESTVHELDPKMILGFMTGDRFWEGYDFAEMADILSGKDGLEVLWRPGGGFYDENAPTDAFGKSHDIGRQTAVLPPFVKVVQSEIENFPYQLLRKTPATVVSEACGHIGAGCTGAAWNLLSESDIGTRENEMMVSYINRSKDFRELISKQGGRNAPEGVAAAFNRDSQVSVGLGSNWFRGGVDTGFSGHILQLGLPAAYRQDKASVALLSGNGVYAFSDDELLSMLKKGIYMDSHALNVLNARGFGEYTGFVTGRYFSADCAETMLDHPFNAGMAGVRRDARQSFWAYSAAELLPQSGGAACISSINDYNRNVIAECALGTFENKLGGRICVSTYYPWTFQYGLAKSIQMKRIFRWLSKDSLPAYFSSYNRMALWAKTADDWKPLFIFANAYMMEADELEISVLTERDTAYYYDMDCTRTALEAAGREGPYAKFRLPQLDPMRFGMLTL